MKTRTNCPRCGGALRGRRLACPKCGLDLAAWTWAAFAALPEERDDPPPEAPAQGREVRHG